MYLKLVKLFLISIISLISVTSELQSCKRDLTNDKFLTISVVLEKYVFIRTFFLKNKYNTNNYEFSKIVLISYHILANVQN